MQKAKYCRMPPPVKKDHIKLDDLEAEAERDMCEICGLQEWEYECDNCGTRICRDCSVFPYNEENEKVYCEECWKAEFGEEEEEE